MIRLVDIHGSHLESFREWRNCQDLKIYFREYRYITRLMQDDWYDKVRQDETQIHFAILKDTELIGYGGLVRIHYVYRIAELSMYINPRIQNEGNGGEALRLLLNFGFNDLELNRIWTEVYSNNEKTLKFLTNRGFTIEGHLKSVAYKEGKFIDSSIVALLRDEYENIISV